MIIQALKLKPFAGLANQNLQFNRSLNVVLGANEAGKSTIVNALKMAMFMATKYTQIQYNKEISRYMPLGGGDTIQVELDFAVEPEYKPYQLFKSWGERKESRLILPDGGLFSNPQEVQEKLRELLVLKEGTYQAVLFAYQSHLAATLETLQNEPEPCHNLADLLRRAIYETDGVPVDLLERRLNERRNQYFSHWDLHLMVPQGNRGIENPWAKSVGKILDAYYQKEKLRLALLSAREYESQLDAINERLRLISEELKNLKDYVETNQGLVADTRQRLLFEAKLESYRAEEVKLKELCQNWPILAKEVKDGPAALETLRSKQTALDEELASAKAYEAQKEARDRFTLAKPKHELLTQTRTALGTLKVVTADNLQTLEELNLQQTECRASLMAGQLHLKFTPAMPMTIQATKGLEAESEYVLHAGQHLELDAGGFISLRHPDWQLSVKSGQVDFEQVDKAYKQATTDFQKLLQQLGVQDLPAAKQAHKEYQEHVTKITGLEEALEEILAGQSYEELQAEVQKALQAPTSRPSSEVALKVGEIRTILQQAEKALTEKQEQLEGWEKLYGSLDEVFDKLLDCRGEIKKLEQDLAKLKPLPPEVTDLDAFIKEFEEQNTRFKEKQEGWHKRLLEKSELQGQAPGETAEEIIPQLTEAETRVTEMLREGEALNAIQSAFAKVKEEMDGQTLTPWIEDLEDLLSKLTGGRYTGLELESDEVLRRDGLKLPGQLLSGGAKVSFGLALRLSMANHFLSNLGGFLVLDDPLVDLDDVGRQQAAVKIIQDFAKEKQVIVLTCKKSHADLLGGNRIDIERSEF